MINPGNRVWSVGGELCRWPITFYMLAQNHRESRQSCECTRSWWNDNQRAPSGGGHSRQKGPQWRLDTRTQRRRTTLHLATETRSTNSLLILDEMSLISECRCQLFIKLKCVEYFLLFSAGNTEWPEHGAQSKARLDSWTFWMPRNRLTKGNNAYWIVRVNMKCILLQIGWYMQLVFTNWCIFNLFLNLCKEHSLWLKKKKIDSEYHWLRSVKKRKTKKNNASVNSNGHSLCKSCTHTHIHTHEHTHPPTHTYRNISPQTTVSYHMFS